MAKVTKQQIEDWKEKHGDVYEFPVGDKIGYLRAPNMTDYKRAFAAMQADGETEYFETLMECLFLGGDQEIKKDDDYFIPAKKELMGFFQYEDAEVTNNKGVFTIVIDGHTCICRKVTREDLRIAERKNKAGKPFVTQDKLFEMICKEKDEAYSDRQDASLRFPLYKALEDIQNNKYAAIKKL